MANVLTQLPNRRYDLVILIDAEPSCFADVPGVEVTDVSCGLPTQLAGVCALLRTRTSIEGFLSFLDDLVVVIGKSGYQLSQVLVSVDGYGVDGCCKNSQVSAESLTGRIPHEFDLWIHDPDQCPAGQSLAALLLT